MWRECAVRQGFDWRQAEDCFGHPMPLRASGDGAVFGVRTENDGLRLTIGAVTYQAVASESTSPLWPCYTLYRNGVPLHTLCGEFGAHSPNLALADIGGKVAWEFADHRVDTIVYDGQDLRRAYRLEGAYRPYALGDRLIFVGKKGGKFFVVYDGSKVGPDFDEIVIAYCCEPVLWSVQCGGGKYLFWGTRGGQSYVVEISKESG